jgi:hypothetical protein
MLASELHDRESVPGIVGLLNLPAEYDDNAPIYSALREMPAPETAGAIRAALVRRGPRAVGTRDGLAALASFSTAEAREALRAFFTSEGPEWRRVAIRTWEIRWFDPMPAMVKEECTYALVAPDIELRRSACRALAGLRDKPRAPELYVRLGQNPCESVEAADTVAKIIELTWTPTEP